MAQPLKTQQVLEDFIQGLSKPPRHVRQLGLENQLIHFRADSIEAEELLPALLGRLTEDEEIAHYALYLRRALERRSRKWTNEVDECDEFHKHRALKEGD